MPLKEGSRLFNMLISNLDDAFNGKIMKMMVDNKLFKETKVRLSLRDCGKILIILCYWTLH